MILGARLNLEGVNPEGEVFKHGHSSSFWLTLGSSVPIDFLGSDLSGDSEDGVLGLRIELGGRNLPYICEAPSSIHSTGENAHGIRHNSSLFSKEQKPRRIS